MSSALLDSTSGRLDAAVAIIHIATAEADPTKSHAVRWLAGNDLKSPT
jgi:hypothetical protein